MQQPEEKTSIEQRRAEALATRQETKPTTQRRTRTRKRSTASLDGVKAAQRVDAVVQTPAAPKDIAVSNATAWKAAVGNAYVQEMKAAVPEVIDFMDQVNQEIGAMLIDEITSAYKPVAGEMLEIEEVA